MTEAEWRAADATELLAHPPARPSARKVRLAYCACLRAPAVWPQLVSSSSRRAVAVSER